MTDPISINVCLALASALLGRLEKLYQDYKKWKKGAATAIQNLHALINTTSLTLDSDHRIVRKLRLASRFPESHQSIIDNAVDKCYLALQSINEIVGKLSPGSRWGRLKFVKNEGTIRELRQELWFQTDSLHKLLNRLQQEYLPTGERVVEEPLHANDEGYFLSDNPPDRLLRVPRSPEPRPSWTLASLLPGSRRRLSLELIEAAKRGDIEDIKRLYHERADINYQEMDNESATALHIAVSNGHYHAVCALVECGCNVNCLMKDRKSPLHIAVQSNNPQIAQYLLTNTYNRANVDAADSSGEVGLFYTSWTNMADVLLRNGAKPNIPNHEGVTPLHRAVRSGFPLDHVRLLLHYKADPNAMDRNGMTPLSMACDFQDEDTEDERYDVVSALLEHGAEVNLTVHGCDDWTPLHFAAAHGYSRILRKLALSPRGGRSALRVVSAEGFTPLHQAVADHRLQCVEALMSLLTGINGALEVQCNEGRTPLHWAVALHTPGDADALTRLLLRAGANASAVDNQGRTPLFYAFSRDVVDQLCEKGADLFRRDPYGATPLHFVALFGSVDAADRLVELGISPTVKDNEHLTPLEFLCREERFWDTEAKWDGAAEFPGRFEMVKHFTSRKWQLPSTTCYAVVSRWKNRSIATQVQKYLDSQCTTVEESLVSWSSFLTAGAAVATGWAVAPVAGVGIAALLGARTVQGSVQVPCCGDLSLGGSDRCNQ